MLGHVQVVKELRWHGADIEAKDRNGSTALHFGCYNNHLTVVVELLDHRAIIDATDSENCTGAYFSILQSLVNHDKASVKSLTLRGDLPLCLACEMPQTSLDTIFLLMKLYPDLVYR
jgi:ankyrin repeat protein